MDMEIKNHLPHYLTKEKLEKGAKELKELKGLPKESNLKSSPAKSAEQVDSHALNVIKELLLNNNMAVNEKSLNLVKALANLGIPLAKENLTQANKAFKLFESKNLENKDIENKGIENKDTGNTGAENKGVKSENIGLQKTGVLPQSEPNSLEKAVFMIKNQITVNSKNVDFVNNIKQNNFTHLLENMGKSLENIKNPVVKLILTGTLLIVPKEAKNHSFANNSPAPVGSEIKANAPLPYISQTYISQKPMFGELSPGAPGYVKPAASLSANPSPLPAGSPVFNLNNIFESSILSRVMSPQEIETVKTAFPELKDTTLNDLEQNLKLKEVVSEAVNKALKALPPNLSKVLTETYSLNFQEPQELIDQKITALKENLNKAAEVAARFNQPAESFVLARDTIEFINNFQQDIYLPFPITINNQTSMGEIFVFKDRGSAKKDKENLSVLVALNTAALGKVEAYIQKYNKNLNIQFRLENVETKKIFSRAGDNLKSLLPEYNLQSISYLLLEEEFTVVNPPQKTETVQLEKYNFDARL